MTRAIIRVEDSQEKKAKQSLRVSIQKKKKQLAALVAQVALLKNELDMIQHEYSVRIGRLYLKDNELDLQMIRLGNILDLLAKGKSPKEALAAVEDTYYAEEAARIRAQKEYINTEEQILMQEAELSKEEKISLKKLWRELLFKFHPDLAQDEKEKIERAEIMKKINDAYSAKDIIALQEISKFHLTVTITEATLTQLEDQLAEIENKLTDIVLEQASLKETEWFTWRIELQKAKKKKTDPFALLEKKLLDDIVKKVEIVTGLRSQLWAKQVFTV